MVPLRRLLAAKLPLADKDMLAARTSRHPSGGRPHFSTFAGRPRALLAPTHQVRAGAHSMRALDAIRREGPCTCGHQNAKIARTR